MKILNELKYPIDVAALTFAVRNWFARIDLDGSRLLCRYPPPVVIKPELLPPLDATPAEAMRAIQTNASIPMPQKMKSASCRSPLMNRPDVLLGHF